MTALAWERLARAGGGYLARPGDLWRAIRWWRGSTTSDLDVVFVTGCPRSGTTLVQRILAVHEDFFSIEGETGLFTRPNPFARAHFGLGPDESRRLLAESADLVDFFQRGVRRIAGDRPDRTFVEKTPQHVLRLGYLLERFPRARFVHVLRDGRDGFASARSHPDVPQRTSARRFARYWDRCVGTADRFAGSPRLTTLRYEALTAAPEEEAARLMAFLGREVAEGQLEPDRIGADRRGSLAEHRRLGRPIGPASVGRWRAELTDAEKAAFWGVAGPRLAAHGYPRE